MMTRNHPPPPSRVKWSAPRVFLVARIFSPPCKQPLKHSPVDVSAQKLPKMITRKATITLDMILVYPTGKNILKVIETE